MLRFVYFEKIYRLIAADLSKQKVLGADSRAIQQIIFTSKIKSTVANAIVIISDRLLKKMKMLSKLKQGQLWE